MTGSSEQGGRIGRDWRDSEPWWPPEPTPPDGAPNVVLVVLDDVGFAQLGCYGSDIATPVIDALAAGGIRLANFRTTALCSPTRACLLTGRNHHRSGMGRVADLASGLPRLLGEAAQGERLPLGDPASPRLRHLRRREVASHVPRTRPTWRAPRATWPLGRGFDRWYGFHGGETHQFVPALYHDNHSVRPPRSIEDGYHLSADLADRAIEFVGDLRAVDADRPFFLYFCHRRLPLAPPGAAASGSSATGVASTAAGTPGARRTYARQLATGVIPAGTAPVAPAAVGPGVGRRWASGSGPWRPASWSASPGSSPTPTQQIGRVLDFLDDLGELDDTLVILVSDNGASAEGGPKGPSTTSGCTTWTRPASARCSTGWTRSADRSPTTTTRGAGPWPATRPSSAGSARSTRVAWPTPASCTWPARLGSSAGAIRHQFAHAIDVLPTVLELVGIEPPEVIDHVPQSTHRRHQLRLPARCRRGRRPERHVTQHFEMLGSRAIYHHGWKAVTFHPVGPIYDDGLDPNAPFDDDVWELYHVAEDLSETDDLAAEQPEHVAELVARWWEEAERNQVLPLDNRVLWVLTHPKPDRRRPRDVFRYFPGGAQVPEPVAVNVRNRCHSLIVEVDVGEGVVPEGVLLALGSALGGWSLHFLDGRLRYVHNLYGKDPPRAGR